MSRKRKLYYKVVIESFDKILKIEFVNNAHFVSRHITILLHYLALG